MHPSAPQVSIFIRESMAVHSYTCLLQALLALICVSVAASRNNRGPNATRKTDVSSSAVKTSSTHVLLVIMAMMTVHFIWASAASQAILG